MKAAVVNGSMGSSMSEYATSRMKASLGSAEGNVAFFQDNRAQQLTAALSNNDYSPKDDILILDSQGHIVEYWDSRDSGLWSPNNDIFKMVKKMANKEYRNDCYHSDDPCGHNNCDAAATCTVVGDSFTCTCGDGYTGNGQTCTPYGCQEGAGSLCKACERQRMRTGDNQCMACNDGFTLKDQSCVEADGAEGTGGAECDQRVDQKARGGKKVRAGKAKSACDCHDICKEKGGFAAYQFSKKRIQKNGKMARKGKCTCYPGSGKRAKARFRNDERYISGTVA